MAEQVVIKVPLPSSLEPPPRSTGDAQADYPQLVDWMYRAYQVIQQSVEFINNEIDTVDLNVANLPDPLNSSVYLAQLTANTGYVLADKAFDETVTNKADILTNKNNIDTNTTNISVNTAAIAVLTTHNPATVLDTSTINLSITGQEISGVVIQGGLDHGSIGGLTDDDHAIYALLAGRAGGQSLIGGTASGEDLTLQSTAHATKGSILFGTSAYDEVNNRLGLGTASPSETLDVNNDTIRLRTAKTPSSATDTGTHGQIAWDSNYIYVCTSTDAWKRVGISTW